MMTQKHSYLFVCLWVSISVGNMHLAKAQPKTNSSFAPHQILISYQPTANNPHKASGIAIPEEHDAFVTVLREQLAIPIQHFEPVFESFVAQLVSQQLSEEELLQQYRQRNRRGPSLHKVSTHRKIDFCRSLCLWVPQREVGPIIERIQAQAGPLESLGFRLTSVSTNNRYQAAGSAPNDPWFPNQYAHQLTGAVAAWEKQEGREEVVIGVVDTGIDPTHEDLIQNLLPGQDMVHFPDLEPWQIIEGEDFLDKDDDPMDFDGHGTAVSGVVAAQGNNALGVSGVCPNCKILPLRALAKLRIISQEDTITDSFGFEASLADAILYGIEQGVEVLNFSFGSDEPNEPMITAAIEEAGENGIVMVGAAGNKALRQQHFPAANEWVLAVASTDENDQRSTFSNFGDWIDVSAPGTRIFTSYPTDPSFATGDIVHLMNPEDSSLSFIPESLEFTSLTSEEGITAPVEFVGLAREGDVFNPVYDWNLEGKIALIRRGENSFYEKVNLVRSFGAIGAILLNNRAGRLQGTLGTPQEEPIPVVGITQEEGEELLEALALDSTLALTLRVSDIVGYTYTRGTSLSAPYVAGMAGLILSQWPDFSAEEVRTLIKLSVDNIDDKNPAFVGELGSGRVNLEKIFDNVFVSQKEELARQEWELFPNPATDRIRIIPSEGTPLSPLHIVDLMGKEVYRREASGPLAKALLEIDISQLPPGNYFVWGDSPKGRIVKQFIKISP